MEYGNASKAEIAEITNPDRLTGSLADVIKGADVFIGVSAPNTVTEEMVKTMNKDAIIFAWPIQLQKSSLRMQKGWC